MATFRTRTAAIAAAIAAATAEPLIDADTFAAIDKLLTRVYNHTPAAAQSVYESILVARYAAAAAAAQVSTVPYDVPRTIAGILAHVHTCGRANVTDVIRGRAVTMRTVVHFATDYDAAQDAAARLRAQGINAVVSSPRSGEFEVYFDAHSHANCAAARAAGVKI